MLGEKRSEEWKAWLLCDVECFLGDGYSRILGYKKYFIVYYTRGVMISVAGLRFPP
jgi:hypothetical protein